MCVSKQYKKNCFCSFFDSFSFTFVFNQTMFTFIQITLRNVKCPYQHLTIFSCSISFFSEFQKIAIPIFKQQSSTEK